MGKLNMDLLKGVEDQENVIENSKAYQDEEKFLDLLKQGKNQKEAYEAIGREKTWASKTIKKIRETAPDRLKGTSEEIKEEVPTEPIENEPQSQNTPQAAQEPQTAPEPSQPIKSTLEEEKHVYGANTKPQKQSFSFRAEQTKIESWKLYAETIGGDVGTLWTAAIDEYIANHKLTEEQQVIYDLKKKIAEMQRKQK